MQAKLYLEEILKYLVSVFSKDSVWQTFAGSGIVLSDSCEEILSTSDDTIVWDTFFDIILSRKGWEWLSICEKLVQQAVIEYDFPQPSAYESIIAMLEHEVQQKTFELLESQQKCPLTGLYNTSYLEKLLYSDYSSNMKNFLNSGILFIGIDKFSEINSQYSEKLGNQAIKACAYVLTSGLQNGERLFKVHAAGFCIYIQANTQEQLYQRAEYYRWLVQNSRFFIEALTVSISVINFELCFQVVKQESELIDFIFRQGKNLLFDIQKKGSNSVTGGISSDLVEKLKPLVLVADTDEYFLSLIKMRIEMIGARVVCCSDGAHLWSIMNEDTPACIVSELFLPKNDGLSVKRLAGSNSALAKIPFILIAPKKDDNSVQTAHSLGIEHYLKKPLSLLELTGIVLLQLRKSACL